MIKKILSLIILPIFILTLVTPSVYLISLPKAEAQLTVICPTCASLVSQLKTEVLEGVSVVKETISAAANVVDSNNSIRDFLKEYVLDGLATAVAEEIRAQIVASIISWINSGFQGSPAFVQDLKGFLLNVADEAIGEYIQKLDGFGVLCSPFRLDIKIALAINYNRSRDRVPSCTLTGIKENIENFLTGTFDENGWDQWFEFSSNPGNTPYGQYIETEAGANFAIVTAKDNINKELNWGSGFNSQKICDEIHGAGTSKQNCIITNPGNVIHTYLSDSLASGLNKLVTIDEINEIFGALAVQLAKQVITGAAGLLGLTSGTGYTDFAYAGSDGVTALVDAAAREAGSFDTSAGIELLDDDLKVEKDFLFLITDMQGRITNIRVKERETLAENQRRREAKIACETNERNDRQNNSSGSERNNDNDRSSRCTGSEFNPLPVISLTPEQLSVEREIGSSTDPNSLVSEVQTNIITLQTFKDNYVNASSTAAASSTNPRPEDIQRDVVLEYIEFRKTSKIHFRGDYDIKKDEWERAF